MLSLIFLLATAPPTISYDPPDPRLGDLFNLHLANDDATLSKASVEVFDYAFAMVRVAPDSLRSTIGVPIDIQPGSYPVRIMLPDGPINHSVTIVDREFESSELRVSKRFTKKKRSAALKARLKRESKQFHDLWEKEPTPARLVGRLVTPVAGRVTGLYGTKRIFNKKRKSRHYGLDLDGEIGDRISAAAAGQIVISAMRWASGGTMVIDHGGGLFTLYFHMSRRNKKLGDWVEAGEQLGAVGKTGRVTGPHLHLATVVRAVPLTGKQKGKARSLYVDPERFLTMTFKGSEQYVRLPIKKKKKRPNVGGGEGPE